MAKHQGSIAKPGIMVEVVFSITQPLFDNISNYNIITGNSMLAGGVMAHMIQIGNSKGIRIPQAIIKQTGFENKELAFKVVPEGLLITPVPQPRSQWAEQVEQALTLQSDVADQEWLDAELTDEDTTW